MAKPKLPEALRSHADAIHQALLAPSLMTWNDDETYADAAQPSEIGHALVKAAHVHLREAKIGYLYRKDIKRRDQIVLAQASKVGGKLAHFQLAVLAQIAAANTHPDTGGSTGNFQLVQESRRVLAAHFGVAL